MIATLDPRSPHDYLSLSADKDAAAWTTPGEAADTTEPSMLKTKEDHDGFSAGSADDGSDSDASSGIDGLEHSDSSSMVALLQEDGTATQPAPSEAAPAKRPLRRKRKRMSEEERRLRHREVQRQFMKRKRAKLAEMRKFLRGLESQLRLTKVSNERARLEEENATLRVRVAEAQPWDWHGSPRAEQQVQAHAGYHQQHTQQHIAPQEPRPLHHHHQLHQQISMPAIGPSQPSVDGHLVSHRTLTNAAPLPWDEILDAVTSEVPSVPFRNMSF